MTPPVCLSLDLPDEGATAALAAALASVARPGDVLALSGPVGAGKTSFARHLIQTRLKAENVDEDVPSPTFTIVQVYQAGDLEIWHCDLYRVAGASEIWELGLEDAFDTALCLIEWPDRLGALLPDRALALDFAYGSSETARKVVMSAQSAQWDARLGGLWNGSTGLRLSAHV